MLAKNFKLTFGKNCIKSLPEEKGEVFLNVFFSYLAIEDLTCIGCQSIISPIVVKY